MDLDGDMLNKLGAESGDRATVVVADATDEDQFADYVVQIAGCRVVGLVNNVGSEGDAVTIPNHSIEPVEHTMRLSVTSALIHMKYLIPCIVDGGHEVRTWYINQTPATRYGHPEEVADAVAFLLSDETRCMKGSVLMLDGGLTASGLPAS